MSVYTNWYTGKPNNTSSTGAVENYVTMGYYGTRDAWNDMPADSSRPFMVEFEPRSDARAIATTTPIPAPLATPIATPTVVQPISTAALTPIPVPPTPTPFPTPRLRTVLRADTESRVHLSLLFDCGENQICYFVTVECNGLVWREVQIRVNHLNGSKGAVVFARGGYGRGFYGEESGHPGQIVKKMRAEGYETYDIKWAGEFGWQTDKFGQGFKNVMCAYADLVRWIANNLADNPEVMGATSNSGGSMHISYGLALYGLEDIPDIVVLTGEPPSASAVDMCYRASGDPALMDPTMGWPDMGDYCERGERQDGS